MSMSPRLLRPRDTAFSPRSIPGLALWLDASSSDSLHTTDAGPVVAVTQPTDIAGCVGWWDASDASTLFAADTGTTLATTTVGRWEDRSTAGNHVTQSNPSYRPARTGTLNGKSVVTFDGTDDFLSRSAVACSTQWTAFAVCTKTISTSATIILSQQPTSGSLQAQYLRVNSLVAEAIGFAATNSAVTDTGLSVSQGVPSIISSRQNASAIEVYKDGVGNGGTSCVQQSVASAVLNISGYGGIPQNAAGGGWQGDVAEIVIYNTALTTAQRASVESYLATKWGISGVHRSAAQEIAAVTSPTEIGGCAGWWDCSRTDKMFNATTGGSLVADGGAVLRLEDLSGNGKHLIQATSGSAPSRQDGAKNGLPALNFAGTKSLAAGAAGDWNFLHNTQGGTVIAVIKPFDTADPNEFAYGVSTNVGGASSNIGWASFFDDRVAYPRNNHVSQSVMAGVSGQSVVGQEQDNGLPSANDFSLLSFTPFAGSSTTAGRGGMYVSGTARGNTNSSTLAPTASNSTNAFTVGAAGSNSIAGLAELIVYNTVLSAVDRARVEKYLQQKWATPTVPDPTPPVGYWADKSGNNRHAVQATAGSRPTISATAQNGRKILTLDGTNDSLNGPAGFSLTDTHTVIAAVRPDVRKIAGLLSGSVTTTNLIYGDGSASFSGSRFGAFGITRAVYGGGGITTGSFQVFSAVMSGGTLPADLSMFTNGAGGAVSTETAGTAPGAAMTANLLLGTTMGSQFWDGDIAEMLIWGRAITTAERQRAERYLAARWGITLAPQVSNLDAQDWINRVYANGGTVSSATAASVNQFCVDIENAPGGSIRDRFLRLNLFCGSFQGAFVPLYRSASFGGSPLGNATDTNLGSPAFLDVDYSESSGLKGNGSSKYLDTGFNVDLVSASNSHMSAGLVTAESASGFKSLMGANISLNTWELYARRDAGSGIAAACFGSATNEAHRFGNDAVAATLAAGHIIASYPAMYRNGTAAGTTATANGTVGAKAVTVFAQNGVSVGSHTNARLSSYSLGLGMTASQAAAFSTAHAAFNAAMGRT